MNSFLRLLRGWRKLWFVLLSFSFLGFLVYYLEPVLPMPLPKDVKGRILSNKERGIYQIEFQEGKTTISSYCMDNCYAEYMDIYYRNGTLYCSATETSSGQKVLLQVLPGKATVLMNAEEILALQNILPEKTQCTLAYGGKWLFVPKVSIDGTSIIYWVRAQEEADEEEIHSRPIPGKVFKRKNKDELFLNKKNLQTGEITRVVPDKVCIDVDKLYDLIPLPDNSICFITKSGKLMQLHTDGKMEVVAEDVEQISPVSTAPEQILYYTKKNWRWNLYDTAKKTYKTNRCTNVNYVSASADASPDGKYLVVKGNMNPSSNSDSSDSKLCIWDWDKWGIHIVDKGYMNRMNIVWID